MRLALVVAILTVACATPLAAQKPAPPLPTSADTAAIVRAATDSAWRYSSGMFFQVVADTAWVTVMRATVAYHRDTTARFAPRGTSPSSSSASDETAVGFIQEMRRVERHNGQWVRKPSTKP